MNRPDWTGDLKKNEVEELHNDKKKRCVTNTEYQMAKHFSLCDPPCHDYLSLLVCAWSLTLSSMDVPLVGFWLYLRGIEYHWFRYRCSYFVDPIQFLKVKIWIFFFLWLSWSHRPLNYITKQLLCLTLHYISLSWISRRPTEFGRLAEKPERGIQQAPSGVGKTEERGTWPGPSSPWSRWCPVFAVSLRGVRLAPRG